MGVSPIRLINDGHPEEILDVCISSVCLIWVYLTWPGGRRGIIPTKTPDCQIQLFRRLPSSFRRLLQILRTMSIFVAHFLYLIELASSLSNFNLIFKVWTHLLKISVSVWSFFLSPSNWIALLHWSCHIRWAYLRINTLNSLIAPTFVLPSLFQIVIRLHPNIVLKHTSGQHVLCLSHRSLAAFHMIFEANESWQSKRICSIDSGSQQRPHCPLCSYCGMLSQSFPIL